ELYNELKRLVESHERLFNKELRGKPERIYDMIADYLKAVRTVMNAIWGSNDKYKFTTSVTLKALIRVLSDLIDERNVIERWREEPGPQLFEKLVKNWAGLTSEFRSEGF